MTVSIVRSGPSGTVGWGTSPGSIILVLDQLLVVGQGWTKPFGSIGNITIYRQPGGQNRYLYVDDTASTCAMVRGYDTMTSFTAGYGKFPTDAQSAGGVPISRATAAGLYLVAIANGNTFYLLARYIATPYWTFFGFGDINPYRSGDTYNTFLMGDVSVQNSAYRAGYLANSYFSTDLYHYMVRGTTQLGSAVLGHCTGENPARTTGGTSMGIGGGGGSWTSPASTIGNWLPISPVYWVGADGLRGSMPGLWFPMTNDISAYINLGDTITGGYGIVAGRTLEYVNLGSTSGQGQIFLETSDTWGGY